MIDETPTTFSPLKGVLLVAATFFYFLIFAQFGFLHILEAVDPELKSGELVLGCMGLGGIIGSLWAGSKFQLSKVRFWLARAFIICGLAAVISSFTVSIAILGIIALIMGLALGTLTVSVVVSLRKLFPPKSIGLWTSIGVGSAYFLCNVPLIFNAQSLDNCIAAAVACAVGAVVTMSLPPAFKSEFQDAEEPFTTHLCLFQKHGLWMIVALFLILIWLDSAAFFIIQETNTLKEASWGEASMLWSIASIHLVLAIIAGLLLDRGHLFTLLVIAILLLAAGAYGLQGNLGISSLTATLLYAGGVSIYSAALVSYGALAPEKEGLSTIKKRAAWVFAIAGWIGSAMGIGMAKDLHQVPLMFIIISLLAFAGISIYAASIKPTAQQNKTT